MGWRDRDYAKFRKDEFEAIYGGTRFAGAHTARATRGAMRKESAGSPRRRRGSRALRALWLLALAVVGTAALLGIAIGIGNSSLGNHAQGSSPSAFVPSGKLSVRIVPPVPHRATRIAGIRLLQYGSRLTLSDSHTPMTGNIVISGRWGEGRWETFAVARGERSTFSFRIPLTSRGVLRLRILYPDGARAVGTYQVR
jgi:hypothetical protein